MVDPLATLGTGAIAGEVSFYTHNLRTASVVADGPLVAWRFGKDGLQRLQETSPDAVIAFHRAMAAMLADRLTATNRLVRFLAQ